MSGAPSALSAKPSPRPSHARAARLETFQREQLIVDYLNRVAIQVSRLSEALLNAFSAMSPSNLKVVDQVLKIVRELDRYGGAFAAEWARANAPGRDAPADEDVAFAKAWLGSGEVPLEGGDDRPENPAQGLENIESAPGDLPLALVQPGEADRLLREPGRCRRRRRMGCGPPPPTLFDLHDRHSQPRAEPPRSPHPIRPYRATFPSKLGKGFALSDGRCAQPLASTGSRDARKTRRKALKILNQRPAISPSPRFSRERRTPFSAKRGRCRRRRRMGCGPPPPTSFDLHDRHSQPRAEPLRSPHPIRPYPATFPSKLGKGFALSDGRCAQPLASTGSRDARKTRRKALKTLNQRPRNRTARRP